MNARLRYLVLVQAPVEGVKYVHCAPKLEVLFLLPITRYMLVSFPPLQSRFTNYDQIISSRVHHILVLINHRVRIEVIKNIEKNH